MKELNLSELQWPLTPLPDYDGPGEIQPFADFLPFIGEVVIAFSRLERRLTWGIESCLKIRPEEADAIQETVFSVSTRIGMFETLVIRHVAGLQEPISQLEGIVKRLRKHNDYRNFILHGPWYGTSQSFDANGKLLERGAMKSKYAQLGAKDLNPKQRTHTAKEMREQAQAMLDLCSDIQAWVLMVFPEAENRIP